MQLAFTGLPAGSETTIVAATPLLASVARQQFTARRLSEGALTWERPQIFTLEAWMAAAWEQVRFSGSEVAALLSPAQEALLWRGVIEAKTPSLFDTDATARLARDAAATIAQWNIPLDHESWSDHQDGQEFLEWWRTLRSRCRDAGWMTRGDLWRSLPQWRERGWWEGGRVAFIGFDALSPGIDKIREMLSEARVFGFAQEPSVVRDKVGAWACDDFCHELEFAARWARSQFEANSDASVGVFVPDLTARAGVVRRTFQDVFYPGEALSFEAKPGADCVFHLNAPEPLLNHPLIANAYLLLDLGKQQLEQRSASAILRCAFIRGAEGERSARAQADIQLRRDRELELPSHTLFRVARHCPVLDQGLRRVAALVRDARAVQRVSGWVQFMSDMLQAVGWPGDSELNADEQQIVDDWKDALSEFGTLGLVAGPVRYEQVLELLRRVLRARAGVTQGSPASAVQILDARGAGGLRFDLAVATGLGDETWPPPIRVSPLIPLRLQVLHGIPGAGAASYQEQAGAATAALFTAAPLTHATFHGSPANLVRPFVAIAERTEPGWTGQLPIDSFRQSDPEVIADSDGPPFAIVETPVTGGTGIIKSQSNCPFQAFAKYRLGAREMRDATFGYDPMDRGNFVHRALERIWQELQTHAQLAATGTAELRELVSRCVAQAVETEVGEGVFASQSRIAEQERVSELLLTWLEQVERPRRDSFTVEQVETEMVFNAGGLPLTIRIDRIDRLADDSVILIDYKTGRPAQKDLNCPRPKEPQLLVYAAASASKVSGIYFGKVKARELSLVGYGSLMKRPAPWDDAKAAAARDEVDRLARDFLAGRAAVHPLKNACSYCEAKAICRVNEQPGQQEEDCD